MDGIMLGAILAVLAGQAAIWYRLGCLEAHFRDHVNQVPHTLRGANGAL